jgi:hypothetical protein
MRRHLAFALVMLLAAARLTAEGSAPAWGISSESLLSIPALDFLTLDDTVGYTLGMNGSRYITSGSGLWFAPVNLPTGTLVTGLELQGCDDTDTGQLTVAMFRQTTAAGVDSVSIVGVTLSTILAAIPNCGQFSIAFPAPVVIDNSDAMYAVRVQQVGDTTGLVRFAGVRLRYKLQVSPAPAVARFTDVPTGHPFFRFVEALAASGITAGCGGTDFCPDDPLTRGQMAVFLAVALGLHFPN